MTAVPTPTYGSQPASLERVRYFPRQFLTAGDMDREQRYFQEKLRRHNRYLHGWGVVCGLEVEPATDGEGVANAYPWRVRVCPGYALGPQGDEIYIAEPVCFDLAGDWRQPHDPCVRPWPCPPTGAMPSPGQPQPVYLAVRYAECDSRPVRVHPVGCACDEAACEYSRTRDDFELALLWELPECYKKAAAADAAWCQTLQQARSDLSNNLPAPVPPCPECCDTPWVILARIQLPPGLDTPILAGDISYEDRRVLYSTTALQHLIRCLVLGG